MNLRLPCAITFALLGGALSVFGQEAFNPGDIFVSTGDQVLRYSSTGTLVQKIKPGLPVMGGMAFDSAGNLRVSDADSRRQRAKIDASGKLLETFRESAVPSRGVGALTSASDVASDKGGESINRVRQPLGEFGNTGGVSASGAWRVRSNGEVLEIRNGEVVRWSKNGQIVQRYSSGTGGALYTLTLDADGTSFWTADRFTGQVFQFDIGGGGISRTIDTTLNGAAPHGSGGERIDGLAVFGGGRVAAVTAAATATIVLTFEGLQNNEGVAGYYTGGYGSLNSGPGPSYGISFNADALALINKDNGGNGNFLGQPSGNTTLAFVTGSAATMNVSDGFTTGFSFYYSAPFSPGVINVWSGSDSTGILLATLNLPVSPAASTNPGICTNPIESYCPWVPIGVTFSGTAHSVDFSGTVNRIGFDNITLGTATAAASVITSISPASATAGSSALTLTVTGSGFTAGSAVQWNGSSLATTFVSSTQLRATVPASLLSSAGVASVTVTTGSTGSNSVSFTVTGPASVPVVVSLSPASAPVGGSAFTLTLTGSGFVSGSTVTWNGNLLPTTFVSATQLTANVAASLIAVAGAAAVRVANPGGAGSNSVTFTVTPPGGTGTVVLTFEGLQNGEGVASYYNSGSGSLGSGPGPGYGITFNSDASAIINSDNGGTGNFQGQPSGKTVLYFLTGSAATMNVAAGFTSGFSFYYSAPFSPGTINVWSGANSTGVLLATLTLPVTPAASSSPGICTTASENYCPWVPLGVSFSGIAHSVDFGGTINHIGFDNITLGSVNAAPPTNSALSISSISPQTAPAGGPSFTLTVNGTGFTSRSVVQWNGNPLATTFISSTQLTAIVPASLISSLLVASVTVTDNGQTTFTISFQTTPPVTLPVTPTGGLAHFAVGQNWTTGIFIVNTGNSTANYGISFYDDNGNPVSLPFSTGAASRLTGSLAPFASTYIEAANANAALVSGWGQISADATIAIQSLFRSTLNNVRYEAAVNSSAGTRAFLMPFDATNFAPGVPLYTGLAIANLDASNPATITCTPRVSGGTVIPGGVAIPTIRPLGHWAGFQFPSLSGQRGTLDCTSSTNVSVVALRFIGTDTFSSLPVINR